jgi:hypothetical protein
MRSLGRIAFQKRAEQHRLIWIPENIFSDSLVIVEESAYAADAPGLTGPQAGMRAGAKLGHSAPCERCSAAE